MTKIAITGVTGLVGGHVGQVLEEAGHHVVGISRQANAVWKGRPGVTVRDLTDVRALTAAIKECDAVLHFADRADRRSYTEHDVDTAGRVITALRHATRDAGVRRLVVASSVYAERDDLYGRSKRNMETAALAEEPGAAVVVLRFPPLHGPGSAGAVRHIIRAIDKGWPLPFALANAPRRFLSLDAVANLCQHLVSMNDNDFARATGRIWIPVDVRQGSLRALTQSLAHGRARLVPVPFIDLLLKGSVPRGQLEADRDALLAATGWQAKS